MGFEKISNNTETPEEREGIAALLERHPKAKKLALMVAVLGGTLSAATAQAESAKDVWEESDGADTYIETDSYAEYHQQMQGLVEALGDEELSKLITAERTKLTQVPELPTEFQDHVYYSIDGIESLSGDGNEGGALLSRTTSEMPDSAENVMFGSFGNSATYAHYSETTDAKDQSVLWNGFMQYDVMAPADVELAGVSKQSTKGFGHNKSEAIEAALGSLTSFLGETVHTRSSLAESESSVTKGDEAAFEYNTKWSTEIGTSHSHYFKSYRVVQEGETDGTYSVVLEVEIGIPKAADE